MQTVDFFTPIVDDPYVYGQIAAANAISDVYAMGGRPLTALAIAAFPADLDNDVVRAIFMGGLDKLREAGAALLGGHTVKDQEIKFGYAVTGLIAPGRVWSNAGARVGDALILTKPLGTGIVSTAIKFQRAPEALAEQAIRSMRQLNRAAAAILEPEADAVGACTDVTGFGLLGHGTEVASASGVTLRIDAANVPVFDGLEEIIRGNTTGGGRTNLNHFMSGVTLAESVDESMRAVLFDPQTSGGLLVTIAPARVDAVLDALRAADVPATRIGDVVAAEDGVHIRVT